MPIFDYPICPGSWQASAKFRFTEAPPSWVGPIASTARFDTLEEVICGGKRLISGCISLAAMAAKIKVVLDAAGVRHSITGLKTFVTGGYPSRKICRPCEHESMNEYAFMRYNEVDPGVLDYRTQPLLFEFAHNGRRLEYSADCVRLLANGLIQVLELKTSVHQIKDPGYVEKLRLVGAICRELGWQFMLVEGCTLRADNVFSCNISEIQSRRFAVASEAIKIRVTRLFRATNNPVYAGDVIDLCGGGDVGVSAMCALMVQRLLYADLRYQIVRDTQVFAIPSCGVTQ